MRRPTFACAFCPRGSRTRCATTCRSRPIFSRAQYYLLVLDEDPADAKKDTKLEQIELMPHFARVAVWRIGDDKQILRVRREAAGELLGATPAMDGEASDARQRQANSCGLALAVRSAIGDANAATIPPSP